MNLETPLSDSAAFAARVEAAISHYALVPLPGPREALETAAALYRSGFAVSEHAREILVGLTSGGLGGPWKAYKAALLPFCAALVERCGDREDWFAYYTNDEIADAMSAAALALPYSPADDAPAEGEGGNLPS